MSDQLTQCPSNTAEQKTDCNKCSFLKRIFSDAEGTPSSGRILSFLIGLVNAVLLACIVHHMLHIPLVDVQVWMDRFPEMVGVMTTMAATPYTLSRGISTLNDIVQAFTKKK